LSNFFTLTAFLRNNGTRFVSNRGIIGGKDLRQLSLKLTFVKNLYNCAPKIKKMKATKKQQKEIQDLLSTITNSLRAFSLKLTGNMNDAEDLYQDTALRIMTNAEKYNPGTNFKAWAVTIMRNIFINNYRKKVRRNLIIDQTPNNYYINSGNKTVLNDGESEVTFNELQELVDRLPDDFRVPFLMAYQGYKYDEIAEQLGSPLGTIKSRIFFARKKLQKMYEEAMRERSVA
jgi:RNA polymerase sigma-70 factor (ECF subfamily)